QQVIDDSESVTLRRPIVLLLGTFGAIAVLLAFIGVYGVLSFAVAERTQEIGVRMATGAQSRDVMRLVLMETLALVATGLSLGSLMARLDTLSSHWRDWMERSSHSSLWRLQNRWCDLRGSLTPADHHCHPGELRSGTPCDQSGPCG